MDFKELKDILMLEKPGVILINKKDELAKLISEFSETYGFIDEFDISDLFIHTLKVLNETPAILTLRIASLFHDIGKLDTIKLDNGNYYSLDYSIKSELIFSKYAKKFKLSSEDIFLIKKLIIFHTIRLPKGQYEINEMTDNFNGKIELLFLLKEANISHNPKYHETHLKELDELKKIYFKQKVLKK